MNAAKSRALARPVLLAIGLLTVATIAMDAQAQYYPYPYPPPAYSYYQVPATPPSWSYDPYTSGMAACPQWRHGDPPCSYTMHPTFGQPDYRRLALTQEPLPRARSELWAS